MVSFLANIGRCPNFLDQALIRSMAKNSDDYDDKHMKIKFISHDKLPPNKKIEIPGLIIFVRALFHENIKNYPQAFLDECLYKL